MGTACISLPSCETRTVFSGSSSLLCPYPLRAKTFWFTLFLHEDSSTYAQKRDFWALHLERMQRSPWSHAETLTVGTDNLLGHSVECAFLFSPLFIYEFLFHALEPFQVGFVFYPFLFVLVMHIFSYSLCQTLKRKIMCLYLAFIIWSSYQKKTCFTLTVAYLDCLSQMLMSSFVLINGLSHKWTK